MSHMRIGALTMAFYVYVDIFYLTNEPNLSTTQAQSLSCSHAMALTTLQYWIVQHCTALETVQIIWNIFFLAGEK